MAVAGRYPAANGARYRAGLLLSCRPLPKYLGKVRETLADMLCQAGYFGPAQEQLRRLIQTRHH
ncbi:hypothetical protein [Hymenobacter terrenus]|uniref:hypothetical protein n=1 Tax=Hymenobacter terrenus TaxID=1629124 RepID=UPI0006196D73|nr:hypothetical protein [Hymenobacter terrenus]